MKIYLVDGTYELFRSYFALPPISAPNGQEVGAIRGIIQSLLYLLREDQVTHIACAFDHVIKSFRNNLYAGYKTGEGTAEELLGQFELAEKAVASLGVQVWPMDKFEADDALATAATYCSELIEVDQILICSPDKDLAQMVKGDSVVCYDRRRGSVIDEAGVIAKFGVPPASIPDLLALTGDAAEVYPAFPDGGPRRQPKSLPITGVSRIYQMIPPIGMYR